MSEANSSTDRQIKLRKYPNRRFYDITRSQHVTLEEIYRLILDGFDIEVSDSKTGDDITSKVLAQVILDHDPLKLTVFPNELLHEVIRANEPLMRDFVEKYFSQALAAFLESQRQFEQYLRGAFGLDLSSAPTNHWAGMMLGPLAHAFFPGAGRGPIPAGEAEPDSAGSAAQLRREIDALRQQVEALQSDRERRDPP